MASSLQRARALLCAVLWLQLPLRASPLDATCTVTTVAGAGPYAYGVVDGVGGNATFNNPFALALNPRTGSLYISDVCGNAIRIMTAAGVVTTLAGGAPGTESFPNSLDPYANPTGGWVDGVGSNAQFYQPASLALVGTATHAGTIVFVADCFNHVIRKITAIGLTTTIAGSGNGGYQNGQGSNAQFNYPFGIVVNSTGTLVVADYLNGCLRAVTQAGAVSVYAAQCNTAGGGTTDGLGTNAQILGPIGLAIDGANVIYVVDNQNLVRRVTPAGLVTTLAGQDGVGGNQDGVGLAASFGTPYALAINSTGKDLYVSDSGNK